ncbi:MAG: toprim domain-containing protein [Agathobacter sp.]|nr:toprim domain-containing protein [Agathobacter sp.]
MENMKKCFNTAIMYLMQLVLVFCREGRGIKKMPAWDFNELSFDDKKEYLKTAFEAQVCKIYEEAKGIIEMDAYLQTLPQDTEEKEEYKEYDEEIKRYKMVFEIAESVKLAIDKANGVPGGKTVKFKCFLHDDSTPSMNYLPGVHGFYCFGCGKQGEVVDVFNLLNLMNIWTGGNGLKFIEQMKMAANMFVDTSCGAINEVYSDGTVNNYHTDFIPYTREMNKVRHNSYLKMVPIEKDAKAVEYLKSRGITLSTAKKLSVMTQYPCDRYTGESYGRGYLVFINSNGSYVRRLFSEDRKLSVKCPWEASKWWNQKNAEVGIFNGQVISHCKQFGEVCFVCESAIDAMSIEECGYHAIGLNGVEHAEKFASQVDKENLVKYICLADTDAAGYKMVKAFKDNELFVPKILMQHDSENILCQYKDVNAAYMANQTKTCWALDAIVEEATKFYGF